MENTKIIPWPRIFAEGTAIVASILFAFAIQAWWENRSERADEFEALSALIGELKNNIQSIESSLEIRKGLIIPIEKLLRASADNSTLDQAELDQLLGSLTWGSNAYPSTGVFQSLVRGGDLGRIANIELRSRISSLTAIYERLSRIQSYSAGTGRNWLGPLLFKQADLAQLTNAQPGMPGSSTRAYPPIPVGPERNHAALLDNQEFKGILVNMLWDHYDAIEVLNSTKSELNDLIFDLEIVVSP